MLHGLHPHHFGHHVRALVGDQDSVPLFQTAGDLNVVAVALSQRDLLRLQLADIHNGGTDNHLCLVDVRNFHITGKEFERRLDEVQITVNKNAIPNDPEKPFVTSGVRVGTPAVTSRGFKEPEMVQIAHWMGQTARDFDTCREQVRSEVDALCRKFPIYQ